MEDSRPPALDVAEAMTRLSGDMDLYLELVEMILDEVLQYADRLEVAAQKRDQNAVSYVAHTLKGAAGNVAATGLVALAAKAGNCGKSGDFEALAVVAVQIREERERVRTELERLKEQK